MCVCVKILKEELKVVIFSVTVLPVGLREKKHEKKMPLSEKKKHNFSKKKSTF